jgi:hypothetical protein
MNVFTQFTEHSSQTTESKPHMAEHVTALASKYFPECRVDTGSELKFLVLSGIQF